MFRRLIIPALVVAALAIPGQSEAGRAKVNKPVAAKAQRTSTSPSAAAVRARPKPGPIQRRKNPLTKKAKRDKETIKKYKKERLEWIRDRANIFSRITLKRDYRRDHVVFRNRRVTAFLDWSDPQHPMFDAERKTGEQHLLDNIPPERRAHVLVVPNTPREHIAKKLGDQITSKDLETAHKVLKEAEALAKQLGIRKAKVWINSPGAISVGYLHVHIMGERMKPYPAALKGKKQPELAASLEK